MSRNLIKIRYPTGAGGQWLSKVLSNYVFTENHYGNFHLPADSWVDIRHNINEPCDYVYSGVHQFNFFCNHVYKFYHLSLDQFQKSDYSIWFKQIVATSFELEKDQRHNIVPYFKFEDLIFRPNSFYNKIIKVQEDHSQPISTLSYFDHARTLFINSCVNTVDYFNNFDSLLWVSFVMGQLMDLSIYPSFDIGIVNNYNAVKDFAWKNYCLVKKYPNWVNSAGPKIYFIERK